MGLYWISVTTDSKIKQYCRCVLSETLMRITYVLVSRAIFSSCKLNTFYTWKQRTTSVHHEQGNRLVERQKKTFIIDALVTVSDERPKEWPYLINRVFFANQAKRVYKKNFHQFFYYITTTQLYQSILLNIEYTIITNSNCL